MSENRGRFAIVVGSMLGLAMASILCSACKRNASATVGSDQTTSLADAAATVKPGSVNELPLSKEVVDQAVNPTHMPEYAGPTGVIEGHIFVTGDPAPPTMGKNFDRCPVAAETYSKQFREGPTLPDGSRALADTLVLVKDYSVFVAEKQPSKQVRITNCAYSTRTVDMTFGQALEIKNDGNNPGTPPPLMAPILENQPPGAILVATPHGDPVRLYPKSPAGRYRLIDRVGNSWMEADVFVFVTPLHTTSDIKGRYRIEGVPVGKVTVVARHPAIGDRWIEKPIEVKDGVVTTLDITIPNDKPAKQPPSNPPKALF